VRSVRPDHLGFKRHLEKVAASLSVASGAVPLRRCEGPLVAQSRRSQECPLLGEQRKTYARIKSFRV
jgi:hypothetical protein